MYAIRSYYEIIANVIKPIQDIALREETKKALITNAKKWHYQMSESYKQLNKLFFGEAKGINLVEKYRDTLVQSSKGLAVIENYNKRVRSGIGLMAQEPAMIAKVKEGKISRNNFV